VRRQINKTEAIFPMPVLMIATYNEDDTIDVMNAAWGMMLDRREIMLNLTENHKTVKNIKERKAFTVSIADSKHVIEADYFGMVSANSTKDKFAKSGLTATKSTYVDAPIINEFPICMECTFIEYQSDEFGGGVVGQIINVTADDSVMSGDNVDISKLNAIAFDPFTHGYYKVSEKVGEAFKDGTKLK
jgi:flavin reductase (DIM6/NTAB) family NADH-FMN oxidoreductase RutF